MTAALAMALTAGPVGRSAPTARHKAAWRHVAERGRSQQASKGTTMNRYAWAMATALAVALAAGPGQAGTKIGTTGGGDGRGGHARCAPQDVSDAVPAQAGSKLGTMMDGRSGRSGHGFAAEAIGQPDWWTQAGRKPGLSAGSGIPGSARPHRMPRHDPGVDGETPPGWAVLAGSSSGYPDRSGGPRVGIASGAPEWRLDAGRHTISGGSVRI
jgi:hypothetical protein